MYIEDIISNEDNKEIISGVREAINNYDKTQVKKSLYCGVVRGINKKIYVFVIRALNINILFNITNITTDIKDTEYSILQYKDNNLELITKKQEVYSNINEIRQAILLMSYNKCIEVLASVFYDCIEEKKLDINIEQEYITKIEEKFNK